MVAGLSDVSDDDDVDDEFESFPGRHPPSEAPQEHRRAITNHAHPHYN